jgi:hypothetical protein
MLRGVHCSVAAPTERVKRISFLVAGFSDSLYEKQTVVGKSNLKRDDYIQQRRQQRRAIFTKRLIRRI